MKGDFFHVKFVLCVIIILFYTQQLQKEKIIKKNRTNKINNNKIGVYKKQKRHTAWTCLTVGNILDFIINIIIFLFLLLFLLLYYMLYIYLPFVVNGFYLYVLYIIQRQKWGRHQKWNNFLIRLKCVVEKHLYLCLISRIPFHVWNLWHIL